MKIRWGIMGTGRIADKFCSTLKLMEEVEIYAVGSRTTEKANAFGDKFHVDNCYGSYEELVADPLVDIVYVATPIKCHYDNVKLCLQAGKHVLCEKLFVETVKEAEELYAMAEKRRLFLMEALWTKFHPIFRKIVQWKEDGRFGQVCGVYADFYVGGTSEHRLYKDATQGGCLSDLLIYPLLYACSVLGYDPEQVNTRALKNDKNVDIIETIQLLYQDGSFASLTGGIGVNRQAQLAIYGTEARLFIGQEYLYEAQKVTLLSWDNEIIEAFEAPFEINGYEYEIRESVRCIKAGLIESPLHPNVDVIGMLRLMEKCKNQWR